MNSPIRPVGVSHTQMRFASRNGQLCKAPQEEKASLPDFTNPKLDMSQWLRDKGLVVYSDLKPKGEDGQAFEETAVPFFSLNPKRSRYKAQTFIANLVNAGSIKREDTRFQWSRERGCYVAYLRNYNG